MRALRTLTCWLTPSAGLTGPSSGALGPWVPCPESSLASGRFDHWPLCPALTVPSPRRHVPPQGQSCNAVFSPASPGGGRAPTSSLPARGHAWRVTGPRPTAPPPVPGCALACGVDPGTAALGVPGSSWTPAGPSWFLLSRRLQQAPPAFRSPSRVPWESRVVGGGEFVLPSLVSP